MPSFLAEFAHLCGAAGALVSLVQYRRMPPWQVLTQCLLGMELFVILTRPT
jgi:hypothetical protein